MDGNIIDLQAVLEASVSSAEEPSNDVENQDLNEIWDDPSGIEPVSSEQSVATSFGEAKSNVNESIESQSEIVDENNADTQDIKNLDAPVEEDEFVEFEDEAPEINTGNSDVMGSATASFSPDPSELTVDGISDTITTSESSSSDSSDYAVEESPEPEAEPEEPADDLVVDGSAGADVLVGDTGNDTITGNGGDDEITGDDGDDYFVHVSGLGPKLQKFGLRVGQQVAFDTDYDHKGDKAINVRPG